MSPILTTDNVFLQNIKIKMMHLKSSIHQSIYLVFHHFQIVLTAQIQPQVPLQLAYSLFSEFHINLAKL
jgi:hypothetical protein